MGWLLSGKNHVPRVSNHLYKQLPRDFQFFWGTKLLFQSGAKNLFESGAASITFYFKVGQLLFQNGAETFQSRARFVSKRGNCFKVGQKLFQSRAKCYFKVGLNTVLYETLTN